MQYDYRDGATKTRQHKKQPFMMPSQTKQNIIFLLLSYLTLCEHFYSENMLRNVIEEGCTSPQQSAFFRLHGRCLARKKIPATS